MTELIAQNLEARQKCSGFKTAYDYLNRLSFTINGASHKTIELLAGDAVCLVGDSIMVNLLLTKMAVHSLMPKKYGGFNRNSKVFILDASNCTDVYQFVDFMKQYGLHIKRTLKKIMISRVFTIYQLTHFLKYELSKIIDEQKINIVLIPDLISMFVQEPDINIREMEFLLTEIAQILTELPARYKVLLISSISISPSLDNGLTSNVLDLRNKLLRIFNKCIEVSQNKTNEKFKMLILEKQGIDYITTKKYSSISNQDMLTVIRT